MTGVGISGSGHVIGKEVLYFVQNNVYNIINSPREVQEGFRKINTISTQLDIDPALLYLHHGIITPEVVKKTQEIAATRHVADQFLEEIGRIEKEEGTAIHEIKVGDVQISKNELLLKEHLLKGNEFFYKKEYQKAIEYYNKALEIDPKYIDALNNKGLALDTLGKYKEAIDSYDKALEIDTKNAYALNNKGLALDNLGRYNQAIECYDKALEIDPKYIDALNNKGFALNNLGKYNEAIECFDKALEIYPKFAYAWNNKGFALNNLGKYNEAIEYCDKSLEIDPKNAIAWYNKGLALNNLGKYNEAIECFDKALEIDPKNVQAIKNRDIVLKRKAAR